MSLDASQDTRATGHCIPVDVRPLSTILIGVPDARAGYYSVVAGLTVARLNFMEQFCNQILGPRKGFNMLLTQAFPIPSSMTTSLRTTIVMIHRLIKFPQNIASSHFRLF
jgi:hypothetical protein